MTNRNKPSIFAQISSGVTEGPAESAPSPNRLEERLDVLRARPLFINTHTFCEGGHPL